MIRYEVGMVHEISSSLDVFQLLSEKATFQNGAAPSGGFFFAWPRDNQGSCPEETADISWTSEVPGGKGH